MAYGFNLAARGPLAAPAAIAAMAREGERLKFGYLAIPDHVVLPKDYASTYPYNTAGRMPGGESGETLEQLSLMAWVAAITEKPRLLTSVMVVPHRPAVLTAKILTTIDVLSNGRVTVGCGAGWMREEFERIQAPPFDRRGAVTDEWLQSFKQLWTGDDPQMDGEFVQFRDLVFLPKPVQRPHPPLWIGGESPAALRRAARYGDVWYPIGANPAHPLDTVARYRDGVARLRQAAEKAGREPMALDLAYWANWYVEDRERATDTGERHLFTGSAAHIVEDIQALKEMGVRDILFNFQRPGGLEPSLEAMQRFADDIMTKVPE